jgi:hypothetical protein
MGKNMQVVVLVELLSTSRPPETYRDFNVQVHGHYIVGIKHAKTETSLDGATQIRCNYLTGNPTQSDRTEAEFFIF